VKLTPSSRVCALGIILLSALTVCSRNAADRGGPYFMASLLVAGIAYLLAIREFLRSQSLPTRVVVFGLVLCGIWQIEFLRVPAGVDDDVHRYVWDGRLQKLGYNPYVVVPSDPAVEALHTQETRGLNHPDLASPYPPGAQLFFRIVTGIHESTYAMRVAFFLCGFAIVFVLLDVLRGAGQAEHWVLAYAWNPLVATEVAGSGHIDIVGVLLLLVSAAALARRWRPLAAVAFGLAVAVKILPIVLLPVYWKRIRIGDWALAALVAGCTCVPFLQDGKLPFGSLSTYVHSFRFNGPIFSALERITSPQIVAVLAIFAGLLTAIWIRKTSPDLSPSAFAWPMAASLFCAPVVYPWYLLWLTPFLRSVSALPLIIWTVSILPTYYVWHLRTQGRLWILPDWIMIVEFGFVAITAAVVIARRMARSSQ